MLFLALGVIGSLPGGVFYALSPPGPSHRVARMTLAGAGPPGRRGHGRRVVVGGAPAGLMYALIFVLATAARTADRVAAVRLAPARGMDRRRVDRLRHHRLRIWAVIQARMPSAPAFAVAWLVLRRSDRDPHAATPWTAGGARRDGPAPRAGAGGVLLLTLALAVPPFARVGERDAQGNVATAPTSPRTSCGTRR